MFNFNWLFLTLHLMKKSPFIDMENLPQTKGSIFVTSGCPQFVENAFLCGNTFSLSKDVCRQR